VRRREFIGLIATLPLAIKFAPEIGERAGGATLPFPDDFSAYLTFHAPQRLPNRLESVMAAEAYLAWARPGATHAQLQMYGGLATVGERDAPRLIDAKRANVERSLRALWPSEHYPGWLRVIHSDDEKSWHTWERVGYLRWIPTSEMSELRGSTIALARSA
jgi:hypothetical protein